MFMSKMVFVFNICALSHEDRVELILYFFFHPYYMHPYSQPDHDIKSCPPEVATESWNSLMQKVIRYMYSFTPLTINSIDI